jgi:hypothetical protein
MIVGGGVQSVGNPSLLKVALPQEATMLRVLLVLASFALLASGSAEAQTVVIQQRPDVVQPKNEIRVQVNVSFFVPSVVSDSEASLKAQEQARRSLYETAAHECDVLRAVLASECRLESLSVNINRNFGQPQNAGFTATGNFAFKIMPK